jgi:transposase
VRDYQESSKRKEKRLRETMVVRRKRLSKRKMRGGAKGMSGRQRSAPKARRCSSRGATLIPPVRPPDRFAIVPPPGYPQLPLKGDRERPTASRTNKKGRNPLGALIRKMGCHNSREGTQLSEAEMRSIGIDLHKRSVTVCVIDKITGETFVRSFTCQDEDAILEFFKEQGPFQAVVEASATYEWLWELLDPVAKRLVLAHPRKLRIIAESKKKTDRLDARTLAFMLAKDEIPEAYRPSPRQREYQHLIKHRNSLVRAASKIKVQIRSILAARNLDRRDIFSPEGRELLPKLKLNDAERFRVRELLEILELFEERLETARAELKKFREAAPKAQKIQHEIAKSVPGVGDVVADVILATLGDVNRFSSVKKVASYAGLVPGYRESDRKRVDLAITKEGPAVLRWALVEAAWRAVRVSPYWKGVYEKIATKARKKKGGKKIAIVAVARRLLGVVYSLLKKGERYSKDKITTPKPVRAFAPANV